MLSASAYRKSLTTTTIANFKGETVASSQLPIRLASQTPDVIVDLIEDAVRECIAKSGIDAVGGEGHRHRRAGHRRSRSGQSHASSVFGEREMPIAPLLEKRMGMPVKIEKPAHLVALGRELVRLCPAQPLVRRCHRRPDRRPWPLVRGRSVAGCQRARPRLRPHQGRQGRQAVRMRPEGLPQRLCFGRRRCAKTRASVLPPAFFATALAGNNFVAALSDAANRGNAPARRFSSGRARCSASACRTSSTCSIPKR